MKKWDPTMGELLKARSEPENEYDKFAVSVVLSQKLFSFFFVQAIDIIVALKLQGKE
jgi:hypothetical protein